MSTAAGFSLMSLFLFGGGGGRGTVMALNSKQLHNVTLTPATEEVYIIYIRIFIYYVSL